MRRRVVVDAAGYRERREAVLQRQAEEAAESRARVRPPGGAGRDDVVSERRVVHEYLRDRGDVETHSEGNEPDRHLVVSPKSAE